MKFEELNLNEKTIKAVKEMGFTEMMPIQKESIPNILLGKDIVGQAQTGTGKTAAFGIPMFENIEKGHINHLILTPTRELAIQIVDELRKIGKYHENITIAAIVGGMDMKRQIDTIKNNPVIVVATPGRLNDFLKRKKISLVNLKMFVIDEVDEMFKSGFKEEIDEIIKYLPQNKQTLLFSATISKNVEKIAEETMKNRININVSSGNKSTISITQECIVIKEKNKFSTLTKLLDIDKPNLAIIFGRTKRRADELGNALNDAGYKALSLHGDLSQSQRNTVMKKFRSNDGHILVATDVAARGIDVTGVTHVYNFDLPDQIEYYTHRIGRTGRAGTIGKAVTFARESELSYIEKISKETKTEIKIVNAPNMNDLRESNKNNIIEIYKDIISRLDVSKNKELANELIEMYGAEKIIMASIEMNMRKENINEIKLTGEPPVKNRGNNFSYKKRKSRKNEDNRNYKKNFHERNNNRKHLIKKNY